MTKQDAYIAKMKQQLDTLNAQLKTLEAQATSAKEGALAKYEQEMGALRHQSRMAVAKLDEIKSTSESGWEAMVAEMEKVSAALVHSFSYFKSQL